MLKNYIKVAWKVLIRNRFFTFVSLFGISLTLGILLVLAAVFDQVVGPQYPDHPDQHVLTVSKIHLNDGKGSNYTGRPSFHFIETYVKTLKSPKRIALLSDGGSYDLFVGNKKLTLSMSVSCENIWHVFQFNFLEGQPYNKSHIDERAQVAVISEATRDAYFGTGVSAVGKTFEIDNSRFKVFGVVQNITAADNRLNGDVFVPYTLEKYTSQSTNLIGSYYAFLEAESSGDLAKIKEEYQGLVAKVGVHLQSEPVQGRYTNISSHAVSKFENFAYLFASNGKEPATGFLITMLVSAMLLFMLLPAMNLVNLNASRILERSPEIGVRKAFGATSFNLYVQFIVENIIITLIGGVLALGLAYISLELIESTGLIKYANLRISPNVFLLGILLSLAFGILSGVIPAWRMSKIQIVNAINEIHA